MLNKTMLTVSLLVAALAIAVGACSDDATQPDDGDNGDNGGPPGTLAVEIVESGLNSPIFLTSPASDSRLFVLEQSGRIWIISGGQRSNTPFLDISAQVQSGGERGLFSMAFHPNYAANGFFFVCYTDGSGATRVERYSVSGDPALADPNSAKLIIAVAQPASNHNGGPIAFGRDGMLYIGLGDGGFGGDPQGNGQNTATLLGSLLRIDVDGGDPYAIPAGNPFGNEIWAYGLRNPWRFEFDEVDGTLYVADVGQNQWEEVTVVADDAAGLNFGWNIMEGTHCFGAASCDMEGLEIPQVEYDHSDGCSITGGYVYRGGSITGIRGHYFYSDYCTGFLRSFRYSGGNVSDETEWDVGDLGRVLSFGEDSAGELYILSENGNVYRLVEAP